MALNLIDNFDTISVYDASILTEAWRTNHELKAFLFHKNDMECLANEEGTVGIRFYLAIDNSIDENATPDMLVVGVDSENNDMISCSSDTEDEEVSGVYDFALPCPKLCDPKSILFNNAVNASENSSSISSKKIEQISENDCVALEDSIPMNEAIKRVRAWQCGLNEELVSVYFEIENLRDVFTNYENTDSIRVYFGLEDDLFRAILIGANKVEIKDDLYKDQYESTDDLIYISVEAPCTKSGNEDSCVVGNKCLFITNCK